MSFLPTTSSVHPACLPVPTAATAAHHTLQLPATAAGRAQPLDYSSVHPAAIQPHSDDEPASPSVSVRWQEPSTLRLTRSLHSTRQSAVFLRLVARTFCAGVTNPRGCIGHQPLGRSSSDVLFNHIHC